MERVWQVATVAGRLLGRLGRRGAKRVLVALGETGRYCEVTGRVTADDGLVGLEVVGKGEYFEEGCWLPITELERIGRQGVKCSPMVRLLMAGALDGAD